MADYHPLLARALKALPDPNDATRRAVYDRARQALLGQLRSLEPPLSEADIEQERVALDAAIDRLEDEYAPHAVRRESAAPPPQPVVIPAPRAPAPVPLPVMPAPVASPPPPPEPVRPPSQVQASAPPEAALEREPPLEAPVGVQRFDRDALPEPHPPSAPPVIVPARPRSRATASTPASAGGGEAEIAAGRAQRPRIQTRAPSGGRPRLLRNMAVALILLIVIGLIAAAAWALRDRPSDLATLSSDTATGQPPGDSEAQKFADRVGGERAPAVASPNASSTRPAPALSPPSAGVSVAQRATLYEENTANAQSPPKQTSGRVVWRLDAVNGGQGQPLETVVRANIEIPEANGLTVALTIRRNLDATLPASHTIELAFNNTGSEPNRTARDVALLQMKEEENGRGSPLVGLPVPVRDNLFLLGLSNLPSDIDRNTDLLQTRNWIDLPVRYANGGRAVITFERGTSGERVIRDAFAQWSSGR